MVVDSLVAISTSIITGYLNVTILIIILITILIIISIP